MKVTDEQIERIARAIYDSNKPWIKWGEINESTKIEFRRLGRAALAACAPILLAEPTEQEKKELAASYWHGANEESAVIARNRIMAELLANRLKSVTEQPDAAVEKVTALMEEMGYKNMRLQDGDVSRIVAAVRQADKEAVRHG